MIELLHQSEKAGFGYFAIGVWDQQYWVKNRLGGGNTRFYRPICFFPGIDLQAQDADGKNHARDMLQQFSHVYQEPSPEDVIGMRKVDRLKR